jgi:7-carboxy-7-deazaguanine synthase (Cx14CxxC type)
VIYSVKEIFLTLQGEGARAGSAAVFIRFTGCNLWSGREEDRARGAGACSMWCDTDFVGINGVNGGRYSTAKSLARAARSLWPAIGGPVPYVVCTGGEPLLQLDSDLVSALREEGFEVAVETNGTQPLPARLDWVCVSPKAGQRLVLTHGNELKLVYPQGGVEPEDVEHLDFDHFFLQPMDGPGCAQNTASAAGYCMKHPKWRLSVQTHKLVGIP